MALKASLVGAKIVKGPVKIESLIPYLDKRKMLVCLFEFLNNCPV